MGTTWLRTRPACVRPIAAEAGVWGQRRSGGPAAPHVIALWTRACRERSTGRPGSNLARSARADGRHHTGFMGLVRHTDGEREWAYDRQSSVGRLDKALDEAMAKGWTVVDMKRDWKVI
jgi:hypothetical protein